MAVSLNLATARAQLRLEAATSQNGPMRGKPIGVWFSLTLAILVLSAWIGWNVGDIVAVGWHYVHPRGAANLTFGQRRHLEAELSDLESVELFSALALARSGSQKEGKQTPPLDIQRLETFRSRAKTSEILPIVDLAVGLAYVREAIADQRDNKQEEAVKYIRAAQPLFQSLGWQDTSEEALKAAANDELPLLPVPGGGK